VRDSGESCDDGNTASGDGCSASCAEEAVPHVDLTVDKPTVTTELLVDQTVTVTVTSRAGFAGAVTLAAEALSGSTPLPGWVALAAPTVTLAAGGAQTVALKIAVPGDSANLAGQVRVTATSAAAPVSAMVNVTASPVASVTYTTSGTNCVYPTQFNLSNPIRLKVGRQFRVVNGSTTLSMRIHFDGGITGISHQGAPMAPGGAYEQTPTSALAQGVTFYCHDEAGSAQDAGPTSARQRLIVVP
jgi:cysteine-rich repeat protein